MIIKVDENDFVVGYTKIGGIEGGIEIEDVPECFLIDYWPKKWAYNPIEKTLTLSGTPNPDDKLAEYGAPEPDHSAFLAGIMEGYSNE